MQGKLSYRELEETVLSVVGSRRKEVIKSGAASEDCAVLQLDGGYLLATVDPITAAGAQQGSLSVHVSANDVAACGGEPVAALIVVLAPPHTPLTEIRAVMEDAENAAREVNLEIVGGHTEYTDSVNRIVTVTTVLGKTDKPFTSTDFSAGETLLLTGNAATEGTGILVSEYAQTLTDLFSPSEIEEGKALLSRISVRKEGALCAKLPVSAMHDVTEGGLLGAVYEICRASGLGATLSLAHMPLHPITKKLCDHYEIDPFTLISSGSMLIVSPQPDVVEAAFAKQGLSVTRCGVITEKKGVFVTDGGYCREVTDAKETLYLAKEKLERAKKK